MRLEKLHAWLLAGYALVVAWSLIGTYDYVTWCLEIAPAVIALVILARTYDRFRFSNFVYVLLVLHFVILTIGAKYTYAREPLFSWLQQNFHLARNNYDKVGHFFQGFGPAFVAREVFLRRKIVKQGFWMNTLIILALLGASAIYEIIEWWVAVAMGSAATDFIGAQGYEWDTQSDMFMCFLGAAVALSAFTQAHDRSIAKRLAGD